MTATESGNADGSARYSVTIPITVKTGGTPRDDGERLTGTTDVGIEMLTRNMWKRTGNRTGNNGAYELTT